MHSADAALVVNSIPVGLYTGGSPLSDADLALLPDHGGGATTSCTGARRSLDAAERRGLRATDGLGMLVHQGAVSWAMVDGATRAA